MRIGEVANRTGIPPRMLRYYECQELVVPGRDHNNYRPYCEEGVRRALQVRTLLDAAIPTRIIRDMLRHVPSDRSVLSLRRDSIEATLVGYAATLRSRADDLLRRQGAVLQFVEALNAAGTTTNADSDFGIQPMRAVVCHGPKNVSVDEVPDAAIEKPTDALIRITTTNICGSDLHMHEGRTNVETGKVLGHENMGEVIEVGEGVDRLKVGDTVSQNRCRPNRLACLATAATPALPAAPA